MEQISSIVKRNQSLTSQPSTNDGLLIQEPQPQEPEQPWIRLLVIIAQDRRHDLPEPVIALWKEKLKNYQNEEICEALKLYSGEFFPTVEAIADVMLRRRRNEATNRPWEKFKAEQRRGEQEGQMATQEQYDELRETFRKIAFGPPLVPMNPIKLKGCVDGKGGEEVADKQVRRSDAGPSGMAYAAGNKSQ